MNTNMIHNVLNIIGLLVGAFMVYDFTALGFSAETAALLTAWFILIDKMIKLGLNIMRDGLTGLFTAQPPAK